MKLVLIEGVYINPEYVERVRQSGEYASAVYMSSGEVLYFKETPLYRLVQLLTGEE